VSIRAVAERVGRTSPAIYLHFADKQTLILSVCDRMFERLAEVSSAAQAPFTDPIDRMRACARAYVDFALDQPAAYRVLFMDQRQEWKGEMATMAQLRESVCFRSLHDNVVQAYEDGRFQGPGPDLTALVLWIAVHGLASLLLAKPGFEWPPVDTMVDLIIDTQLRGILADGER
jgi:AcrR family transcriptional regulator